MSTDQRDALQWINHWQQVQPTLDRQRIKELRMLTVEDRRKQIANLLELAVRFQKPRQDQGLVILQQRMSRIFGK